MNCSIHLSLLPGYKCPKPSLFTLWLSYLLPRWTMPSSCFLVHIQAQWHEKEIIQSRWETEKPSVRKPCKIIWSRQSAAQNDVRICGDFDCFCMCFCLIWGFSLHSSSCPGTHHSIPDSLQTQDPPTSASLALRLQARASHPAPCGIFKCRQSPGTERHWCNLA